GHMTLIIGAEDPGFAFLSSGVGGDAGAAGIAFFGRAAASGEIGRPPRLRGRTEGTGRGLPRRLSCPATQRVVDRANHSRPRRAERDGGIDDRRRRPRDCRRRERIRYARPLASVAARRALGGGEPSLAALAAFVGAGAWQALLQLRRA